MVYKSKKNTTESKQKSKFRQSAKWKKFRSMMKKSCKVDFVTQKPLLKGFQVHHADMRIENYTDLTPENFFTLNKTSHEIVHFLFRYEDWRGCLKRIKIILEKMEQLNPR